MLAAVFATFTVCYLTRTLYDITVEPNLQFMNLFTGVCLPLIWDSLPISLMFAYHYQNLKLLQNKKKKVNESRQNTASSTADASRLKDQYGSESEDLSMSDSLIDSTEGEQTTEITDQ